MEERKKKFFLNGHLFTVPEGKTQFHSGEIEIRRVNYDDPAVRIEDNKLTIFGVDFLSNQ